MSGTKTNAQVQVLKAGPNGRPVAQVRVDPTIGAAKLGALLEHVATHEKVFSLAGLKACGQCKSGLDISIIDHEQEIIQVAI